MRRKVVFLDIDGTLIGSNRRVPRSAVDAVHCAQQQGHVMLICTGRSIPEIGPEIMDLGCDGVVAVSGAYVAIHDTVIMNRFIEPAVITAVSSIFDRLGVDYLWQSSRGMWATETYIDQVHDIERSAFEGERRNNWHSLERAHEVARKEHRPLGELVPGSKGTFFALPERGVSYQQLCDVLADQPLDIVRGSLGMIIPANGEATMRGVNKALGLQAAVRHLGASVDDAIAIGDSDNDLDMIRAAGIGVAMGNAIDSIKQAADFTTTGVDDDGIAHAFHMLGLLDSPPAWDRTDRVDTH